MNDKIIKKLDKYFDLIEKHEYGLMKFKK